MAFGDWGLLGLERGHEQAVARFEDLDALLEMAHHLAQQFDLVGKFVDYGDCRVFRNLSECSYLSHDIPIVSYQRVSVGYHCQLRVLNFAYIECFERLVQRRGQRRGVW